MVDLTTQILERREGFSPTPYKDTDGRLRVGYGSDTYTDAQGNVHPVTASTVVTQADASRDLARRIPLVQQGIISNVGQQAWDNLNVNQQAAVTDLGYNYGGISGLPSLTKAIQSGDPTAISQAIGNRAVDNGGMNTDRRTEEANLAAAPVPPADIPNAPNSSGSPDDRNWLYTPPLTAPSWAPALGSLPSLPPASSLPTLAPPNLSLNPPMPPPLPASYSSGPETSNWAPPIASLALTPQMPGSISAAGSSADGSQSAGSLSLAPQAAPTPAPLPAFLRPTLPSPPPASTGLVRLPSGQMIAPGNYAASNDGSTYTVADDGTGKAVVTMNNPGVVNIAKMGPNTIAGGYIGNAISSAIPQVQANVGTALDAAGSKIGGAVDTAKANIGGFLGGIGSLFGGGGAIAPPPVVPPPPTTQYTQQQMQVANPAYEAYIKAQNADDIGAGPGSFADLQSSLAALTPPTLPTVAPPKTITVSRPQPVLAPPPPMATIATDKTVPVGSISQGGIGPDGQPYTYTVRADGSIVDNNGRVTALPTGPVGVAAVAAQNNFKSALSGNLNRGSSNSAGSAIMRGY